MVRKDSLLLFIPREAFIKLHEANLMICTCRVP
jgi:hypothetical protein